MKEIVSVTLKGIFRDRVFQGILAFSLLFPVIPVVSSLSMRQMTELTMTMSLSLISFILLLLSVFLGATSIWKDIERRYTFSVISLPISRKGYLLGKFVGIALFMFITLLVMALLSLVIVKFASSVYAPERPVVWGNFILCILFDYLKYVMLVAFALFFSTFSTSFFLPVFGSVAVFFAGSASQQVFEFINSPASKNFSPFLKRLASILYYLVPNFSAFDLKVNAIYGIVVPASGIFISLGYFLVYTALVLICSVLIFCRREML